MIRYLTLCVLSLALIAGCSQIEAQSQIVDSKPVETPPPGIEHPPVDLPPSSREIKRIVIGPGHFRLSKTLDLSGVDNAFRPV